MPWSPIWPADSSSGGCSKLTLAEVLAILAVLFHLVLVMWPVLSSARGALLRAACTSHLRQIGRAYEMYRADYEKYPEPVTLVRSPSLKDRRLLLCPDDAAAKTGALTSYSFRAHVPPDWAGIEERAEVDANTVLVVCDRHVGRRTTVLPNDETRPAPPQWPFHLVLRAGGRVGPVPLSRIRKVRLPGPGASFTLLYPGEPGYDRARR